ncbi:hypothetical protein EGR_01853 [Echinococcus granulosus]|uniref:Uncharacterized protein n=1 Tax=Echinococcus granulosus TaxID=6210 RepID=W6UXR2_ECHGR|nr:hypothetical protein EGR_01853 [Echinococcus granulosus]EUB63362.1 hypothetical protein EGR_01853 [Echinococcus granulosus]
MLQQTWEFLFLETFLKCDSEVQCNVSVLKINAIHHHCLQNPRMTKNCSSSAYSKVLYPTNCTLWRREGGNAFQMLSLILILIQCILLPVIKSKSYILHYEFTDFMDIPCVVVEVSCNSSFSIIKNDENVSFAFDYTHNGSGSCSLRSGSFVNMRLQKGYIVHWFWFFTPEPFMEMFGQGFNTVGAEEYLLHGTYALTNLSVFNEFTNETYCANVTALPGMLCNYGFYALNILQRNLCLETSSAIVINYFFSARNVPLTSILSCDFFSIFKIFGNLVFKMDKFKFRHIGPSNLLL